MRVFVVLVLLSVTAKADQISIPNTLSNNTVADAIAVQENFDTLASESNENDSRIAALEFAGNRDPIVVDCTDDPAALQTAINGRDNSGPSLSFDITGTCEVEYIWTWRNWAIRGVGDDAKIIPSEAALAYWGYLYINSGNGAHLSLRNLSVEHSFILAERNGSISLQNVSFEQTTPAAITANTGGFIRFFGAFNSESDISLFASNGGVIQILGATGSFKISAQTNGTVLCAPCENTTISRVDLKGGSTFCAYNSTPPKTIPIVTASFNSNFLTSGGGSLTVDSETIDGSSIIDKSGSSC